MLTIKKYEEIKKAVEETIKNVTKDPQWSEEVSNLLGLDDPEISGWVYYKDKNGIVYGYVDSGECYPAVYTIDEFLEVIKPYKLKLAEEIDHAVQLCTSSTFQEDEEVTKLLGLNPEEEMWFIRKNEDNNYECTISDNAGNGLVMSTEEFKRIWTAEN